jgi:CO/xanthine dehydrogenase FAD-binding subunit
MECEISLRINGAVHRLSVDTRTTLLDAFVLISVAAALDVVDGTVRAARVALGGVARVPWRAFRAEEALCGAPASRETLQRAAEAELAAAPITLDHTYTTPAEHNNPLEPHATGVRDLPITVDKLLG